MPTWQAPPMQVLQDTLGEVVTKLESDITSNPDFEEIAGISLAMMMAHAHEAISSFRSRERAGDEFVHMVQIYILGFIVGKRFSDHGTG